MLLYYLTESVLCTISPYSRFNDLVPLTLVSLSHSSKEIVRGGISPPHLFPLPDFDFSDLSVKSIIKFSGHSTSECYRTVRMLWVA